MGKSKIDKDALVPSAKLTFLTGLLQGIKGAVDTQKAKETERQKQQFQMMKFLLPLQQKQRELEQRQSQFEVTEARERAEFQITQTQEAEEFEFQKQEAVIGRTFEQSLAEFNAGVRLQIQNLQGVQEQDKAKFIADVDFKMEEFKQLFAVEQQQRSIESAEGIAARREGGLDKRAEEARLATVEAGLTTNFRKNEDVLRSYQEELADPTSEFRGDPKLAQSAVRLAQRMLIDWAQLRDIDIERGQPVKQIPDVLKLYEDSNWFKDIFGGKEFGVKHVVKPEVKSEVTLPRPAPAVLAVPGAIAKKAEIARVAKAVKDQYKGGDIPDVVIQGLRSRFTEEEVQKIIGKK